ncbi:hypothetical protein A9Q86_12390 [Flavobacteriales bacterium 33_180_T64]|nr:hypothetical protein A9Q86_12390 [Flavobacteriales bacterium 33_180_T64]
MWEEATYEVFPVVVDDESGKRVVINNLFEAKYLNKLIWEHFIPVTVSESMYKDLYDDINGKRSLTYIDKFNDDSVKIMDVNGNIINTAFTYDEILNLTALIRKYYLDTSFLKGELIAYSSHKNFNTAFHLCSKYIDLAIYVNDDVKLETIKLSSIYWDEASRYLLDSDLNNKEALTQKLNLLTIQHGLVLNKAKKVLRQLKRIDSSEIDKNNEPLVAFLYLTAYRLLGDEKNASAWRSKVSLVNLKKANAIITNAQ